MNIEVHMVGQRIGSYESQHVPREGERIVLRGREETVSTVEHHIDNGTVIVRLIDTTTGGW